MKRSCLPATRAHTHGVPLITAGIYAYRDGLWASLNAPRRHRSCVPRLLSTAHALACTLIHAGARELTVVAPDSELGWLCPPAWTSGTTLWRAPANLLDDIAAVACITHHPYHLAAILAWLPCVPNWRCRLERLDPPLDQDLLDSEIF